MNIVTTVTGDQVNMDQTEGHKDSVVAVFKSANGYYVYSDVDNLVSSGTSIEYEGEREGDDMEFVGVGFLV